MCAILMVSLAPVGGRALAQDVEEARARLTAAFVLNFIRFTQWPDTAFAEASTPIRIAVIGETKMLPYLRALTAGEQVEGRAIAVIVISPPRGPAADDTEAGEADQFRAALSQMHAVFLPQDQRAHVNATLRIVANRPILTMSDVQGFVDAGGMLGLYLSNNRMVFDANLGAIRSAHLRVSSKVLSLAQRVREEGR